jgi:hypothetical protein
MKALLQDYDSMFYGESSIIVWFGKRIQSPFCACLNKRVFGEDSDVWHK